MTESVNYPELGSVSEQRRFYRKGERYTHPCGIVYEHNGKDWVPVWRPGDPPLSEAPAAPAVEQPAAPVEDKEMQEMRRKYAERRRSLP